MQTQNLKVEKKEKSVVLVTGEIAFADLETKRDQALKKLGSEVEIKGFRKGNVPTDILIKHIGEGALLGEMAQLALGDAYPKILADNKIDAIGHPNVTITKLAPGNPLGFTIEVATVPEVTLPKYATLAKDIVKEKKVEEVTDTEVNEAIEHIRKMSVGHVDKDTEKQEVPELTDEYVKKIGDFENVDDFKKKVRESLVKEKDYRAQEETRVKLVEKLIAESKIEVPEVLVKGEVHKMIAQLKDRIAQMKKTYDEYLKEVKKTNEDIEKEVYPEAEKRTKLNLILFEIAKAENIKPDEERVKKEVAHIKEHHKEANDMHVRAYVENVLTNEAVFEWLEKQK